MKSELERDFIKDFPKLLKLPPVLIELSAVNAWQLMSQLQLALRHPLNKGPAAKFSLNLAKQLQGQLAITETLKEVAEMGWHPEFDE